MRAIAQLIKSQSLEPEKQLLCAITIVALSESEGNDISGEPLPSERCKKYLKAQIAEESVSIPDEEVEGQEQVNAGTHQIQTDARHWVTEMLGKQVTCPG